VRITPRPDPRKGVFETMLVLGGEPVELEAHLDRLAASLDTLYEADLPRGATNEVRARARAIRQGKLRLTVSPAAAGELETEIATAEVGAEEIFPGPEQGISLRSLVVDRGLGNHKWADRRLLEQAEAAQPGELALVVDSDGTVLEAARASVFAVLAGGQLRTPASDGRILPGIARQRVLDVADDEKIDACEDRLTLDHLDEASEVFLAGSVRGIEPVGSVDGSQLPAPGPVSSRIAAGLRRRWLRVPQAGSAAAVSIGPRAGQPAR
jgi:para-aminobenzoate synthetase / 4-amino-4-deoxychorismate lyase